MFLFEAIMKYGHTPTEYITNDVTLKTINMPIKQELYF